MLFVNVADWMHVLLFKEAEVCIKELNCSSKHYIMVSEAINIAIEKKLEQGALVGELLHKFVGSGLVSLNSFKLGYVFSI